MKRYNSYLAIAVAVALMAMISLIPASAAPNSAPAMAVTPVTGLSAANSGAGVSEILTFFSGTPAAYLTPVAKCFETANRQTIDLVYTSASVAAVTITQKYGNDQVKFAPGISILSSATPVVTPVSLQVGSFNAFNCVEVVSANATPIAVYVKGLAK